MAAALEYFWAIPHNSTYTLTALALVLTAAWVWMRRSCGKLPPGPPGYPLIGNAIAYFKASKKCKNHEYILSLHQKYGELVRLKAGALTIIFLGTGPTLKKFFHNNFFDKKPTELLPILNFMTGGRSIGLALNNGPPQVVMKKLALQTMRDLGVGKKSIDELISIESNYFCQHLQDIAERNGGIIDDIKSKAQLSSANIIHAVTLGTRYEYDDPRWVQLLNDMQEFFAANLFGSPETFIPALRYIPFLSKLWMNRQLQELLRINSKVRDYIAARVDEHRATYCEGEIRDFVDLFLQNEAATAKQVSSEDLFGTISDLFKAGSDTTATSLAWCIQYMVKYQDLQEQLAQEIFENIGKESFKRSDKEKLVKTLAFINETLRYVSIAHFTPPHTTHEDVEINGYHIPARTLVIGALYAIHHNKEYWGDPENFRIGRWIDEHGKLLSHESHFMPFSSGKRMCPGKQLFSINLIVFLVQLIQRFKFEEAPGYESTMSDEHLEGIMRCPHSFYMKLTLRS